MIERVCLVAQTPAPAPGPGGAGSFLFLGLMLAMITFMLLSARSQKKRERRKQEAMYASMSKNDRVQTIGGVVATVFSVKDNEVVLKVDESTNTKMTFVKSAIQRIITDDASGGDGK